MYNMRYNKRMIDRQKQSPAIAILLLVIIALLCVVGVLLMNVKDCKNNSEQQCVVENKTDDDVSSTTLDFVDGNVEDREDSFVVDGGLLVSDKYIQHSACIDLDVRTPYYTRTFISGYTQVQDDAPVVDACADFGMSSNLLIEFSCDGDELTREEFECSYGCMNGACMLEDQAEVYAIQGGEPMVEWNDGLLEFSIVNAYIGKIIAPYGTLKEGGGLYRVGDTIQAVVLSMSVQTGDTAACAPLDIKRVIDESGVSVAPNMEDLQFVYTGGCYIPEHTQAYSNIIFVVNPGENMFIFNTGGINSKTFILEKDTDGAVIIDKSLEVG